MRLSGRGSHNRTSADLVLPLLFPRLARATIAPDTSLQEQWALDTSAELPAALALRCCGFFDQIHQASYHPPCAYDLRLNWAVRLAGESSRRWRRYSFDALQAITDRQRLRLRTTRGLPGCAAYRDALAGKAPVEAADPPRRRNG